jgi:serine protease Do
MIHRFSPLGRVLLAASVCCILAFSSAAQAQPKDKTEEFRKDNPRVMAAFKESVAGPSHSTVRITCDGKEAALGTVVGADGWIITKGTQLSGKVICRFQDGRELEAKIAGIHDRHDLALLKVEAKDLKPVEWAESKTAPVGNWVASVGLGEVPVAIGVVSVASRSLPFTRPAPPPGTGGYLGVALDAEQTWAKVKQVMPDSGASKAGLKVNDVILSLDGKPLEGMEKFIESLLGRKPGDVIKLKIKRGDMEVDVEATLGKRPVDKGTYQNHLGSELSHRHTGFPTVLQHDTVLKPTDCGGPLVDLDGKVIGINVARAGRTESYAIPSEVVRPLLPDLMSGKLAPPKEPSAAEKLSAARQAFEQAEKAKAEAAKKAAESKAAFDKAEAESKAAEKKLAEARAALEKAEKEAKDQEKK